MSFNAKTLYALFRFFALNFLTTGVFMKIRILLLLMLVFGLNFMALSQPKIKFLSIGLNASGDLKITRADGKRLGFDAITKKSYNEIPDATISTSRDREPVYRLPIIDSEKSFTIKVFGRKDNKKADLAITGENFVVRFVGLSLVEGKIFTIKISPQGNNITFSCNKKTELPTFTFAVDSPDANQASYILKLNRTDFNVAKLLNIILDSNNILRFKDNDKPNAVYTLNIIKINADGTENTFSSPEITSKNANNFELDFNKWNGTEGICLRNDKNRNGFKDEKCLNLK